MDPTRIHEAIQGFLPEIVALRHALHAHPEIRFEEVWTSNRIAAFLDAHSVPYQRGYAGGTGIVATLGSGDGPVVALRTDMDALEIEELASPPYRSTLPHRMHACGHDGHMATLCGVIKLFAAQRETIPGSLRFIFQPAEEMAAGGRLMVEEGAVDGVKAAFALHCWPGIPVGSAGAGNGIVMASADTFRMDLTGLGGHAANPGATRDPVIAAAQLVNALNHIVSREMNPWEPAVLSVTQIHGGAASNVIPESAWIEGTFRATSETSRGKLFAAVERVGESIGEAYRVDVRLTCSDHGYPPVYNDPAMAALVRTTLEAYRGSQSIVPVNHPYMTAEDFSFYLQQVPGAFIFLGNDAQGIENPPSLHSPYFNFNDDALPIGIELMARTALNALQA
ncbi:MAG: amidohydrolase [Candidatus Hydrogenedentes bacterium]|nr:amidohydrolase [Candidatus Hydrogenedentota bacterium]